VTITYWIFVKKFFLSGRRILLDPPCLDGGSPLRAEIKDGVLQKVEPQGIMGYTFVPFREWFDGIPYAGLYVGVD
jgi:hypothetical protein